MFLPSATRFTPHNSIIYVLNADYPYIVLRANKRNKEKLFLIQMGKGKKPRTKDDVVIPYDTIRLLTEWERNNSDNVQWSEKYEQYCINNILLAITTNTPSSSSSLPIAHIKNRKKWKTIYWTLFSNKFLLKLNFLHYYTFIFFLVFLVLCRNWAKGGGPEKILMIRYLIAKGLELSFTSCCLSWL